MATDEVEWMRQVSGRFAYPPALLRYALAAGLNGRPEESRRVLDLLCRSPPRRSCAEARESWTVTQARYPVLGTVSAPEAAPAMP